MTVPLQELRQLTWLAHQRSDGGRHALLGRITDMFMAAPGSYTEQQRDIFGDILERLAYALEQEVREELACRIADEVDAPRMLVLRLANDVISVARPVLEQSPALTECDLIQLSRLRSQDHLLAITRRVDIGVRLSAVLTDYGDEDVAESLLRNENADIASDTLQRLADRAKGSDVLQSALIDRGDVPKAVMLDLIEHVSEKLKSKLLHRLTDADRANLDDVIRTLKAKVETAGSCRAEREIEELARRGKLDQFALARFVKESKSLQFLLGLARLSGIDVPAAWRILGDGTGTALAIVCRAHNFSTKTFKQIAMSPLTSVPSHPSCLRPLVWVYGRLSKENAQHAMQYWQTREEAPQPDMPRMAAGAA